MKGVNAYECEVTDDNNRKQSHEVLLQNSRLQMTVNNLTKHSDKNINSPSLYAEQTEWSPGPRQDTTPQRSDTSVWRQCYRGWVCGKWPSSSSLWWTTRAWFWRQPAAHAGGGPRFGSAPTEEGLFHRGHFSVYWWTLCVFVIIILKSSNTFLFNFHQQNVKSAMQKVVIFLPGPRIFAIFVNICVCSLSVKSLLCHQNQSLVYFHAWMFNIIFSKMHYCNTVEVIVWGQP